jgi:SNF2 family DNA or RNA helicase
VPTTDLLHTALLALEAATRDGRFGFVESDERFGLSLASYVRTRGTLTPRQRSSALAMLTRGDYRSRLAELGINLTDLTNQERESSAAEVKVYFREPTVGPTNLPTNRRVSLSANNTQFEIQFPFDDDIRRSMNEAGADWSGARKVWTLPVDGHHAVDLYHIVRKYDFAVRPEAEARLFTAIRSYASLHGVDYDGNVVDAPTYSREFSAPGFGNDELRVYPFQAEAINYALDKKRVLVADEMGLGKTVVGMGVTAALNVPTLVVTTASMKYKWRNEFAEWVPDAHVRVLEGGNVEPLYDEDVIIINYDLLVKWAEVILAWEPELIIFDESHYLKSEDSLRTKAATAISISTEYLLLMSGTPIVNGPSELIPQLQILHCLDEQFGGWLKFVKRYCDAKRRHVANGRGIWDVTGASRLDELHARLTTACMIRRTKADVLPELPAVQRALVPVRLDNEDEYVQAEEGFRSWWQNHRDKRAEAIMKLQLLRRLAGEGKVQSAVEWARDFLEGSDQKLVVFAYFVETQWALFNALHDYNVVTILGEMPAGEREKAERVFQTDPECRVIVCSLSAAREGLTLTAASNVLFVEVGWTPAGQDQAEGRVYGRINDPHGANAWYLTAEGTVDDHMLALLARKQRVVAAVTDGSEKQIQSAVLEALARPRTG